MSEVSAEIFGFWYFYFIFKKEFLDSTMDTVWIVQYLSVLISRRQVVVQRKDMMTRSILLSKDVRSFRD